jgi:hypothetical protein
LQNMRGVGQNRARRLALRGDGRRNQGKILSFASCAGGNLSLRLGVLSHNRRHSSASLSSSSRGATMVVSGPPPRSEVR